MRRSRASPTASRQPPRDPDRAQAHGSRRSRSSPSASLTGEAVRQQLLQLQREGWVESIARPRQRCARRTGRPATIVPPHRGGRASLPEALRRADRRDDRRGRRGVRHDAAVRVLDRVDERSRRRARAGRERTVARRARRRRSRAGTSPTIRTWSHERDDGDFRLIERNCPFYNTAMRRPALCSVSVNALTRLLGVRVHREETFQNGDGRCVVPASHLNEPIDATGSWQPYRASARYATHTVLMFTNSRMP